MNEFIMKTKHAWHHAAEDLPPIGQVVEVLCTIITKASLLSLDLICGTKSQQSFIPK